MAKFAAKDSNKNITLSPHGTGKVVVGTGATDATVQSDGNHNLVLQTGNATTGSISITDGADGDIAISPNGTGTVVVNTDLTVDNINIDSNKVRTTSSADLQLTTSSEMGVVTVENSGNIRLSPHNTGLTYINGSWTATGQTCADLGTVTTADINGGTITGITDLAVADGGTGASNASDARTNLGLAIGTNVFTQRTITGTANEITVTNGDGVSGNPTISLPSEVNLGDSSRLTTDEIQAYDSAGLKLYDDGGSGIFVEDGGNVGIGTDSPSQLLHVASGTSGTVARITGPNAYDAESGLDFSIGRAKISGFLNSSGGTPGTSLRFYTMPDGGSVTEAMRITSTGQLCVGRTSGSGNLNISGSPYIYSLGTGAGTNTMKYNASTGQVTYDTSSKRFKENIRDSIYGLNDVLQMRSTQFEYKDDGRSDIGFIAEELNLITPELVMKDSEGRPESVSYDRLVSVLTKAIQELSAKVTALEGA